MNTNKLTTELMMLASELRDAKLEALASLKDASKAAKKIDLDFVDIEETTPAPGGRWNETKRLKVKIDQMGAGPIIDAHENAESQIERLDVEEKYLDRMIRLLEILKP